MLFEADDMSLPVVARLAKVGIFCCCFLGGDEGVRSTGTAVRVDGVAESGDDKNFVICEALSMEISLQVSTEALQTLSG